jgi:prophage regulatory protein
MPTETASRILRLRAVLDRTGLSRSTLYRKVERGTFPMQVRISERCIGWRESDVERWLSNPTGYSQGTGRDPLGFGWDE